MIQNLTVEGNWLFAICGGASCESCNEDTIAPPCIDPKSAFLRRARAGNSGNDKLALSEWANRLPYVEDV